MSSVNTSPRLLVGQLWDRQSLIARMGISPKTLTKRKKCGLLAMQPDTRDEYFFSDDVIQYMREDAIQKRNSKKE